MSTSAPTREYLPSIYRTHTCGELRKENSGQRVTLAGWVMRKRDHGGVIFIDLRDHYGVSQIVFAVSAHEEAQRLKNEAVIQVSGEVRERGGGLENAKLATGQIEVHVDRWEVLSSCDALPFQVADDYGDPEATRLRFRFLELRREKLHANIMARNDFIRRLREAMHSFGFFEFQTPRQGGR